MQVTIRQLQEQDAYTSVKWRNDPEVFKYTGNVYTNEIKIENELEWISKVITNNKTGIDYRCAILADNVYVGNIYLTDIDEKSAIYHIFIGDKTYWGKGIAKQASFQILNYAFYNLKLEYVELRVKKQNTRAHELYKKLGFIEVEKHDVWICMRISKKEFHSIVH